MPLTYKNFSQTVILNKLRDIRYANGQQLFGFYNTVNLNYNISLDVPQIVNQADIFAKEILANRGKIDLKRFLGTFQEDWKRLLHEAYVYDRLRAVYYGLRSVSIQQFPEDVVSFPGHIILMRLLSKRQFSFNTNDSQPFNLFVGINSPVPSENLSNFFNEIFSIYPDLNEGINFTSVFPVYRNQTYEAILNGLFQYRVIPNMGRQRNGNPRGGSSFYQMNKLDDQTIAGITTGDQNPITNSHLSSDGTKFFFIHPASESGPMKMRFNESLYLSRGIGIRSDQLYLEGNTFYSEASRNRFSDPLTREEIYAITGIKTEHIPANYSELRTYLGINSYGTGTVDLAKLKTKLGLEGESESTP